MNLFRTLKSLLLLDQLSGLGLTFRRLFQKKFHHSLSL
jgi:hypothetical protein